MLRNNQRKAIDYSLENDFESGVHFHATGTGKSWIALELILQYNKKYPTHHCLWMCEQKSILVEQFQKKVLKERGYSDLYNTFMVINYSEKKEQQWFAKVNSATFWKKPILLIINRQFLVSQKKYQHLKLPIGLVIHDECHSIINKTTQLFYDWLLCSQTHVKCLGFSATPYLEKEPYNNILTHYTIYDAYVDNVIVPPKIKWIESTVPLSDIDILRICKENIEQLPFRKVIVWCGIIEKCYELAKLWKKHLYDYQIFVDTSMEANDELNTFLELEYNGILFCAAKHREGSDIKNLDGCIFLDKVENRNAKTFVQCIGRVLRKDHYEKKKYGLILDLKASSCIKICDRMNEYLQCGSGFPWDYHYIQDSSKHILSHELLLQPPKVKKHNEVSYSIEDVVSRFIKPCPNTEQYLKRLQEELSMLKEKNLQNYLIRAVDILEITDFIPHVTRGSCGSSLVCYLLGISNVDPVKEDIRFARFLNDYRDNLPDIDFDFPHYLRDEVFLQLELTWPNQVARISNHVHWHEKSALREALRHCGFRKQIPKEELHSFIDHLPKETQEAIYSHQQSLENTFRHYSLHCGGIVFFHEGIPPALRLNKKTLSQIIYDKNDVSNMNHFKIDILSSRGISQLMDIVGKDIQFDHCPYDEKTYAMLTNGDNIGITLAESPLMRKALLTIKPKSIKDIAVCLAIIRPAAKETRYQGNEIDYNTQFIFDDDAIHLLSTKLNIDDGLADKFRRNIAKDKWTVEEKEQYQTLLSKMNDEERSELLHQLKNLRLYSFCKSHSYSYAQLVYHLAYQKAHQPKKFWSATLKNVSSSYRKWVHLYQACINGVSIDSYFQSSKNGSIYAEQRRKNFKELTMEEQIKKYGYWEMNPKEFYPNCYFYEKDGVYLFNGLIASARVLSTKPRLTVCSIGVKPDKFIEVYVQKTYINAKHHGLKGRAKLKNELEQTYVAHISRFY